MFRKIILIFCIKTIISSSSFSLKFFFILLFLVFFSIIFSTFVGQLFNFLFGFFLYGKKVFGLKTLNQFHLLKYILLNIFIWNLNWILISNLKFIGFSKNVLALIVLPPLALISYLFQRKIVFTK